MIEITMPRLSDTMEEGAIASWHKKPGDRVEIGDILVEIETDKATMDYEAYEAGTFSKILVEEGENVAIGTPIALIDDGSSSDGAAEIAVTVPAEAPEDAPETAIASPSAGSGTGLSADGASTTERRIASPLVRRLARDHELDLGVVSGTGPGGRIIRADIEHLLDETPAEASVHEDAQQTTRTAGPAPVNPPVPVPAEAPTTTHDKRLSESVPMSNTRRVIARRLGESARSIPHFSVTARADAEALVSLRAELNTQLTAAGRPKVSINDLLIRASALALREHPLVNASYIDDESKTMLVHHRVNIGVAVASENGLIVPVIENADQKTATQLGVEAKKLVALANEKKLRTEQLSGGTFTISNLGMFGVEEFTAIVNPPEGAILSVGGTKREAVVVGEEIVAHHVMRYTLSADHRIVDGALAAQFLQTLTRLIENPWTILA